VRETFARDLGALLHLREYECALQDRLDKIADSLRAPGRIRRIEPLCVFDISRQFGDMGGQGVVTGSTNVGVCRVGFLNQRAEQTRVIWQFALQNLAAKIDVAEQAFERVLQMLIGCRSEKPFRRRSPKGGGGKREFVLAFEVMEKAAFGHARFVADVINRRRGVTFGPDYVQRRVQGLVFDSCCIGVPILRYIPTSGYVVKTESGLSFCRLAHSLRVPLTRCRHGWRLEVGDSQSLMGS
jgi:hypothetical protein